MINMNMEDKKKRTTNFSNNEKKLLSELVMKYKDLVENKRTDASTNSQKTAGWQQLCQEYNTISSECYRNASNLKTCWENIKRCTKKQVTFRKKEMFMTGGGTPLPPLASNSSNSIVEAVLGPALEGLINIHDSDGPDYNVIGCTAELTTPENIKNIKDVNDVIVINVTEEKENYYHEEPKPISSKNVEEVENSNLFKHKDTWESWTPKSLKRPLAEKLRPSNSAENWMKRRRPKMECTSDILIKEKIELVRILKKNAEEEGKLRLLILEEQLKQENIKTSLMSKND